MPRPKHPDKELEKLLVAAELQGWRIEKRPRAYFKMKCPCSERHIKTVRLSPSNPNYAQELVRQLKRATCWKEGP